MLNKLNGRVETIKSVELQKLIDSGNINIVDVRGEDEYSTSVIPGAVNIPMNELEKDLKR